MTFSFNISGHFHSTVPPLTRHGITPRLSRHGFRPLKTPSSSIQPLRIKNPGIVCSRSAAKDTGNGVAIDLVMFEPYMEAIKRKIIAELEKSVPLRHPQRLHESMRHTLLSTRRCSVSSLCIASCQAVGGDDSWALPVACAVEMISTMSLIHDDLPCMDDADLRRGKLANHKAFDEATALLAGDALICLAFEHLARHAGSMSPEQFVGVMLNLSLMGGSEGLQGGQMMDKLCEGRDDVGLAELEDMQMHKSGKFIGGATACGAIVGGGNEDEVERLRRYGTKTGILFQVVDDIINVTKTREETGKSVGNDLANGKLTYVKLLGIEGSKKYTDQLLEDVLQELSLLRPGKVSSTEAHGHLFSQPAKLASIHIIPRLHDP